MSLSVTCQWHLEMCNKVFIYKACFFGAELDVCCVHPRHQYAKITTALEWLPFYHHHNCRTNIKSLVMPIAVLKKNLFMHSVKSTISPLISYSDSFLFQVVCLINVIISISIIECSIATFLYVTLSH